MTPIPTTSTTIPADKLAALADKIDDLEIALLETKIDLLSFPGDKTLIANLEKAYDTLESYLNTVRDNLATRDSASTEIELALIKGNIDKLKAQLKTIEDNLGIITTSTVSPEISSKLSEIIDSWVINLLSLKANMLSFSGDKSLMTDLLNENNELSSLLNTLQDNLPTTTPEDVSNAINRIQALTLKFDNVVANQGNNSKQSQLLINFNKSNFIFYPATKTTVVPAISTVSPIIASQLAKILDSLNLVLLSTKSEILSFPGDKSLVSDFSKRIDVLTDLVNQLKSALPTTTFAQINDASNRVQALKTSLNDFFNSYHGNLANFS